VQISGTLGAGIGARHHARGTNRLGKLRPFRRKDARTCARRRAQRRNRFCQRRCVGSPASDTWRRHRATCKGQHGSAPRVCNRDTGTWGRHRVLCKILWALSHRCRTPELRTCVRHRGSCRNWSEGSPGFYILNVGTPVCLHAWRRICSQSAHRVGTAGAGNDFHHRGQRTHHPHGQW
jgi:hypothetical protein